MIASVSESVLARDRRKEQVVTHVLLYAMKIESGVVSSVLVARHHLMSMLSRERERQRVCLSALNEAKKGR